MLAAKVLLAYNNVISLQSLSKNVKLLKGLKYKGFIGIKSRFFLVLNKETI